MTAPYDICHCCGTAVSHDPETGAIICDCLGGPVVPPEDEQDYNDCKCGYGCPPFQGCRHP